MKCSRPPTKRTTGHQRLSLVYQLSMILYTLTAQFTVQDGSMVQVVWPLNTAEPD